MTRSFLFSLLTLVVLVVLLLVTSINVWQLNRTERRLIEPSRTEPLRPVRGRLGPRGGSSASRTPLR